MSQSIASYVSLSSTCPPLPTSAPSSNPFSTHIDPHHCDSEGRTALHNATTADQCLWLMQLKADINVKDHYGFTPLRHHARNDRVEPFFILLQSNADVTIKDYLGSTILHWAAANNPKLIPLLIDAKADVCATDDYKSTPLHDNSVRHIESIELLIKSHADVNAQNEGNYTPLHDAVVRELPDSVRLLLDAKADVTIKGEDGETPLSFAEKNNKEIYDILVSYQKTQ